MVTRPGAGAFRAGPADRGRGQPRAGDTSWQEVALSAEAAADAVPRSLDASGILAMLAAPPTDVIELSGGYLHSSLQPERALAAALARASGTGRRSTGCPSCAPGSPARSAGPPAASRRPTC